MINGIKTNADGDHCAYCDAKVVSGLYNFCPKCGNPLTVDAIRFKDQQTKKVKLELLDELAYQVEDEKALKVILEKTKSL